MKNAAEIVRRMIDEGIEPDAVFVADAGEEFGVAEAWKIGNRYVVRYGDDAVTYYSYTNNIDDLALWLD